MFILKGVQNILNTYDIVKGKKANITRYTEKCIEIVMIWLAA